MAGNPRKKPPRAASRRRSSRSATGSRWPNVVVGAIVLLGVIAVIASRGDDGGPTGPSGEGGPRLGDHWHAAIGVNICGTWQPDVPEYHNAVGVHSHGDGLMHIHPTSNAGTGSRANLGLFFGDAGKGFDIGGTEIEYLGKRYRNGDTCPDGKAATVRWSVNGDERTGDPSKLAPKDGDVVAIAFLPKGQEIGTPPSAGNAPTDVPGAAPAAPLPTDLAPTPTAPPADGAGAPPTTPPGEVAQSSGP